MDKIIFSPISKHLKLDFSMSHSDERSISEEISPRYCFHHYDYPIPWSTGLFEAGQGSVEAIFIEGRLGGQ